MGKLDLDSSVDKKINQSTIDLYKLYKRFYEEKEGKYVQFIWGILGHVYFLKGLSINAVFFLDPEIKPDLQFVRIYFNTVTFDRVKKDRAAKFVDMLSAIGGTMGLLTGFSIISGMEIVYFAAKIIFRLTFNEKKYIKG